MEITMKEISLHILDIMQNSVAANASLIGLEVIEDEEKDILSFTVTDNGKGMSEELIKKVIDPFTTGRTTRKVGLGIPLTKLAAEMTGGYIKIESRLGEGTVFYAVFGYSHIDRQPLGDMAQTMHQIITSFEDVDFTYRHVVNGMEFSLDTREIKKILGGVSLKENDVSLWIYEYLKDGEKEISDNKK